MKVLVILNPASGKKTAAPIKEAINTQFKDAKIEFEIYETKKEDNIGDIIRARLQNKFDLVVAAGGDGTVSAVINGVVGTAIPLGIIPAGTGNLLAHELDIPLEIKDAVALIAGIHKLRKIDAMRIGKRAYILNISLGASAAVVNDTSPENKKRFGRIAYFWTVLSKLFTLRQRYLTVSVDGKALKYHAIEVAIFNSGNIVKTLYPKGPDIRLDDGYIDVWIMGIQTILDYPQYLFEMITGKPAKRLSHFIKAGKTVSVKSRISLPVQADGDIFSTTPIEVEVMPAALTVVVGEKQFRGKSI
jgi:YegS/Rv2252/BmrU family lipid kinase